MKLALVTGASSGLGEALCQLLTQKNIPLLITGRDPERLNSVAKTLPTLVEALPLDLTKDRKPLLELIRKHTPDLVINNAGYAFYGPALMHTTATQMEILEVNAAAPLQICLEAARALFSAQKQGIILNISSTAGELSVPSLAMYGAAKACLTAFSKNFDAEMRPHGIRILVAIPGQIETPFAFRASRENYKKHTLWALKKETVVQSLWTQIQNKKGVQIIGWRSRLELFLARLFPRSWSEKVVEKALSSRYEKHDF